VTAMSTANLESSQSSRLAGMTAIVSAPIAFASAAVTLSGADWDSKIFETPTRLLAYGASAANAVRIGMVLDVIGYYALLVPVLLLLHRAMARRRPDLAAIATFAGATYIIVGATGAGILSAVWPSALNDIGDPGADAAGITASFDAITNGVVLGMWNIVGSAAIAVWLLIVGSMAWGARRAFAGFTVIIAIAAAVDTIATALNVEAVSSVALQVYIYTAPLWAAWLGIDLMRGREPIAQSGVSATIVS
jgi:hypothetical protein